MATKKALKLREDEHRLMLANGIKAIMASQERVVKSLDRLITLIEKEKPNVAKKPIRK